jgi:hypothetical protein
MKFKIIPESTIRDAMNVTPLKRIRKPRTIPARASREIKTLLAYQRAGTFKVAFQIGLIVRKIPIGPLNIMRAKIVATRVASDSTVICYSQPKTIY